MDIGSRQTKMLGMVAFILTVQVNCASGQFFAYPGTGMSSGPTTEKLTTLEAATLQTIPEQETFKLRRAKEFADDRDFRSANALWQSVLDLSGSQLTTNEKWHYRSGNREYVKFVTVANQIESILSKLSADGHASYRLKADAEARALLLHSAGRPRIEVLSEVVRRFFLSSEGDEAAFELACLKMDGYDFNDASRLLRKCLEEHPDCTVPRKEILLRLSVANARLGDATSSEEMLKQLAASGSSDKRIAIIQQSNRELRPSASTDKANQNRLTKYGDSESSGAMGSIAEAYFVSEFSEKWSYPFEVNETQQMNNNPWAAYYGDVDLETVYAMSSAGISIPMRAVSPNGNSQKTPVRKIDRNLVLGKWRQHEWMPVGDLLLNDGLLYFKNGERVVCSSIETGESKWFGKVNEFQMDPATSMSRMVMGSGNSRNPKKSTEVQLFGDQVFQAMSIGDGILYSLEGPTGSDPKMQNASPQMGFNISIPARGRRNWLAAYDSNRGDLLWRRRATDELATDANFDVGFSTAPVFGGGLAFATVNDLGAVSLIAIDPKNGKTVWKTYLCDEPIGRCLPWAANSIAYSGGEVYVGTGAGIIAAVESVSGVVRWVIRYDRTGTTRDMPSPFGLPVSSGTPVGWREDVVVPNGHSLLVMGSDSDMLFALDRRTGELIWDAPRLVSKREVNYYLGLIGKRIYVAGKNCVRCYDLDRGTVVWESEVENSFGKGIVTSDALYIPSGSSILRLSPEDGRELSSSKMISTTGEPVGNLYSDGKQLLGVGMSRIYSLEDLNFRMERLATRIAGGDPEGLLERMRLHAEKGDFEKACSDLYEAYERISMKTNPGDMDASKALERACEATIIAINELGLTIKSPRFVLQRVNRMVDDWSKWPGKTGNSVDSVNNGIKGVVYASLCTVVTVRHQGLASELLAIAPRCEDAALIRKAVQAVSATCLPADYELFRTASKDTDESRRVVAIAGLVQTANADRLVGDLKAMLDGEKSDFVRFHCAIAMANAKERQSLSVLCSLLDTEDLRVRSAASQALKSIAGLKLVSPPKVQQSKEPQETPQSKEIPQAPTSKEQWQLWIASNGEFAPLTLPYLESKTLLDRTLVCNMQASQVREYDAAGKMTWSKEVNLPLAARGLNDGHRLVASFANKEVIEYDEKGKEFWRVNVAAGHPTRINRLENGNTLVLTQNESFVVEYRMDKSIAWQYAPPGGASDAQRMPSGNTLIAMIEGQVLEVNSRGEVVWSMAELAQPTCVQALENGNVLIGLSGEGSVIEVTREKKRVWTKNGIAGVLDMQRLEDGNTMVVDQQGVHLFDPLGKSVPTKLPQPKKSGNGRITSGIPLIFGGSSSNPSEQIHRAHRF